MPYSLWLCYNPKNCNSALPLSQTHTITQMHPHSSKSCIRAHSTKWIINTSSYINGGLQSKHALLLREILNWIRNIAHSFSENIAHSFSSVPHKVNTHMVNHFLWQCSGVLPCHCQSPNPWLPVLVVCVHPNLSKALYLMAAASLYTVYLQLDWSLASRTKWWQERLVTQAHREGRPGRKLCDSIKCGNIHDVIAGTVALKWKKYICFKNIKCLLLTDMTDVNKHITTSENIYFQYFVRRLLYTRTVNQFSRNSILCYGGATHAFTLLTYSCVF